MANGKKTIEWDFIKVRSGDLKLNPANPKKKNEAGLKMLQKITKKFGLVFSGICNKDLTIIDGHSRHDLSNPDDLVSVFVPSRQLSPSEYSEMNAIYDLARAGDVDMMLVEMNLTEEQLQEYEIEPELPDQNSLGDTFELAQGDKAPFQQMTFTVATGQAEIIKNAISNMKITDDYKAGDNMGNENSNGNAIYLICKQWGELRK